MSLNDDFSSRIRESSQNKQSNIILALDPIRRNDLPEYLYETIGRLESGLCAVKLNLHVLLPLGQDEVTRITKMCHSYGLQVIADIKLNDIPSTNEVALECLLEEGIDAVIANPIIGRLETVALARKARSLGVGILALIYMSHPGASQTYGIQVYDNAEENGIGLVPLYKILLRYAKEARVDGLVVGATRSDIIKEVSSAMSVPIFSPGLGHQGGSISKVSKSGVDYFIIGRSIIQSAEPLKTMNMLRNRLKKF